MFFSNNWRKFSSFSIFSLIASAAVVFTAALPSSSVKALGDADITVANGTCELTVAGLGRGSAQDPFVINSAKSLAELRDCRSRTFTITGAVANGDQVTFSANNALGIGHSVTISSVDPSDFDGSNLRVVVANATEFTVQYPSTVSATYTSSGTVSVDRDYYELGADIDLSVSAPVWNDLSSTGWTPLPEMSKISLDGKNKTINALTIDNNASSLGLFAGLVDSEISNLRFTSVDLDQSGSTNRSKIGALVADGNRLNIRNVHVSGSVVGSRTQMGLLAGYIRNSNISDVSSQGTMASGHTNIEDNATDRLAKRPERMGGLIGESVEVNLNGASSSATVLAFSESSETSIYGYEVGGLVGNQSGGNISNSFASGNVTGNEAVGGLIGQHNCCGTISQSFANGNVTGISSSDGGLRASGIGGFIGSHRGSAAVSESYSTGNVTVTSLNNASAIDAIGGFIGNWGCCGAVTGSYSTGNITIDVQGTSSSRDVDNVGGFIGNWNCCGLDFDNYATGDVTITSTAIGSFVSRIGGYVGAASCCGQFESVRASGNISITATTATQYVGGLVGSSSAAMQYLDAHAGGNIVVENGYFIGGFIGSTTSGTEISDSSATGSVTTSIDGDARAGGFIGYSGGSLTILRSFSTGAVLATPFTSGQTANRVGGLIGDVGGALSVEDSFTRSNVTATNRVGGLFGISQPFAIAAHHVYVANTVTATGTDPIVDAVSNGAFIDVNGTSVFNQDVSGSLPNKANFTGKTTAEMKTQSMFTVLGFAFDGDSPVWRISATENDGYPALIPRSVRGSSTSTTTGSSPAPAPQIIEVPAAAATCVAPATLRLRFVNGSSRLTAKANRQIRSYVSKVKASNCTQLNLRAYYVKNSPLAKARNKVLVTALKKEFWRQQAVVRLRTSIRATKTQGILERTVRLTVPR